MFTLVMILMVLASLALLLTTLPTIPGSSAKGTSTTIRWGIKSSGVVQAGGMFGAIVTKINHEALGGAPTIIEDDAGFAAILIMLLDGDKLTITCIDDSLITFPQKADWCSFKVPGQAATNPNFICIDNNAQLARKELGTRSLVVEYHPNIVQ